MRNLSYSIVNKGGEKNSCVIGKGMSKNARNLNFENLVDQITHTFKELEQSVRASHILERKQFQNELQLHIDKHQLSLSLDQQKYHNRRLAKLAMSLSDSSSSSGARTGAGAGDEYFRGMRETCEELKSILRKRDSQLRKVKINLKQVTEDNIKLARAYESRSNSLKDLSDKYEKLKRELLEKNQIINKLSKKSDENHSNCEHEKTMEEITLFYESQIAELTNRLEEQNLYSLALEEQQMHLAQEQSLAEFEKVQRTNSRPH